MVGLPHDPAKSARPWNTNVEAYRAIFNAALTGVLSNPGFYGPGHQGEARSAVAFADAVVLEAIGEASQ